MSPHNMTETPRHSVSVAAAIFDDSGENVLLIKRRDNGHWEPPGGVLELNETLEDGLRREVREETGAEIEIGPLTGVYKNMPRGIIAFVFRCRLATAAGEESPEATEIEWHKANTLKAIMTTAYSIRIADAQANLQPPRLRYHDGRELSDADQDPR